MSSGGISQKQLWGRQLSELPSMDEDQQLRGTEGQVQELSHEELTPLLDEEISDHLTENQYANILEMLRKVQLLLEKTTGSYARELVETGAGIQGLSVMSNSVGFPANKTNEKLKEQLEEMQPEQMEGQHEQLEEIQPEQLAEGQHEQLEVQPEQLAEGQMRSWRRCSPSSCPSSAQTLPAAPAASLSAAHSAQAAPLPAAPLAAWAASPLAAHAAPLPAARAALPPGARAGPL